MPLKDKHVLITGGTGDLGIAITSLSLVSGAKRVILPYRTQKSIDALKATFHQMSWTDLNLSLRI